MSPKKERAWDVLGRCAAPALLIALALLRFALIPQTPLYGDEAFYAQTIDALIRNPLNPIPDYLGSPSPFKPPAGFYAYAAVIAPLKTFLPGLPVEFAYRTAPALFAALSLGVFYCLAREFAREREALYAAIAFGLANASLEYTNVLILDSALVFFSLCALFCYVKALNSERWLALAAACSVLAALTKTYAALAIPLTAFAIWFSKDPRRAFEPRFLTSLFAVPLAMLAYAALYSLAVPGGLSEITSSFFYDSIARLSYGAAFPQRLALNSSEFFNLFFPWIVFAILGAALLNMKKFGDKAIAAWSAVSLIPLANSTGYHWYFVPVVPPLALLASRALEKMRSKLAAPAFALAIILLAVFSLLNYAPANGHGLEGDAQKQAGLALRDSEAILSLTTNGVPEAFFYAFHGRAAPNFSGIRQFVQNPFGPASYTAAPSIAEIVWNDHPRHELANATPERMREIISAAPTDAVLFDAETYAIYAKRPLDGYALSANFSGEYLIVKNTRRH